MVRSKTAKMLGKGKGRKGKAKFGAPPPGGPGTFFCTACNCGMGQMDEWISHVNGKRHFVAVLLQPEWRDPFNANPNPQQAAATEGLRRRIEPVRMYCAHFTALVKKENQSEYDTVMDRIASREPAQLERLGFTLLDVVPDRAPGPRNGVLFMKRFGGELPFSPELGPGQPVFVTVGHAEEVNDKIPSVTFRGEVIGITRQGIEVKGLPNPMPPSRTGAYRIDAANSEVTMERMLACLEALLTAHATNAGSGVLGPGILAPYTPVAQHFFGNILESQARARAHIQSIFSSTLPSNRGLSDAAQTPAAVNNMLRNRMDSARVNGDRQLELVSSLLNPCQREAVRQVVEQRRTLTLIQGPPGTGKTTTAVAIICEWLLRYRGSILATAYSNQGVNNLMAALIAKGVRVIRVGKADEARSEFHVDRVVDQSPMEQERRRLQAEMEDIRRKLSRYGGKAPPDLNTQMLYVQQQLKRLSAGTIMAQSVEQAEVVCTTCIGAGLGILRALQFPFVLVDEATQCPEPASLIPFFHNSAQVVMVGDQCQLPPTVLCDEAGREGLDLSMFDRLISEGLQTFILDTQYRMHPSISAFSSKKFYKGLLKDGVDAQDRPRPHTALDADLPSQSSVCIINVNSSEETQGKSKRNPAEAQCVAVLCRALVSSGIPASEIGIITPYAAHVGCIAQEVKGLRRGPDDLNVSSVDGFQGQERDVIILSTCRANPQKEIGFVADWRRMNVSLTRARFLLLVVCHAETLCGDRLWYEFFNFHPDSHRQWDASRQRLTRSAAAPWRTLPLPPAPQPRPVPVPSTPSAAAAPPPFFPPPPPSRPDPRLLPIPPHRPGLPPGPPPGPPSLPPLPPLRPPGPPAGGLLPPPPPGSAVELMLSSLAPAPAAAAAAPPPPPATAADGAPAARPRPPGDAADDPAAKRARLDDLLAAHHQPPTPATSGGTSSSSAPKSSNNVLVPYGHRDSRRSRTPPRGDSPRSSSHHSHHSNHHSNHHSSHHSSNHSGYHSSHHSGHHSSHHSSHSTHRRSRSPSRNGRHVEPAPRAAPRPAPVVPAALFDDDGWYPPRPRGPGPPMAGPPSGVWFPPPHPAGPGSIPPLPPGWTDPRRGYAGGRYPSMGR